MGKFVTKKCKGEDEIAEAEVSQAVGVQTRARTLAVLRGKSEAVSGEVQNSYLELRSRRLVKTMPTRPTKRRELSPVKGTSPASSGGIPSGESEAGTASRCASTGSGGDDTGDVSHLQVEALLGLGENDSDCDCVESVREATSASDLRAKSNALRSATSQASNDSDDFSHNPPTRLAALVPSASEIEEFFTAFDKEVQRRFTEKYNYDVVKDIPLAGRYEWVKITP